MRQTELILFDKHYKHETALEKGHTVHVKYTSTILIKVETGALYKVKEKKAV